MSEAKKNIEQISKQESVENEMENNARIVLDFMNRLAPYLPNYAKPFIINKIEKTNDKKQDLKSLFSLESETELNELSEVIKEFNEYLGWFEDRKIKIDKFIEDLDKEYAEKIKTSDELLRKLYENIRYCGGQWVSPIKDHLFSLHSIDICQDILKRNKLGLNNAISKTRRMISGFEYSKLFWSVQLGEFDRKKYESECHTEISDEFNKKELMESFHRGERKSGKEQIEFILDYLGLRNLTAFSVGRITYEQSTKLQDDYGIDGWSAGWHRASQSQGKSEIALTTKDKKQWVDVFIHELGHSMDLQIRGNSLEFIPVKIKIEFAEKWRKIRQKHNDVFVTEYVRKIKNSDPTIQEELKSKEDWADSFMLFLTAPDYLLETSLERCEFFENWMKTNYPDFKPNDSLTSGFQWLKKLEKETNQKTIKRKYEEDKFKQSQQRKNRKNRNS